MHDFVTRAISAGSWWSNPKTEPDVAGNKPPTTYIMIFTAHTSEGLFLVLDSGDKLRFVMSPSANATGEKVLTKESARAVHTKLQQWLASSESEAHLFCLVMPQPVRNGGDETAGQGSRSRPFLMLTYEQTLGLEKAIARWISGIQFEA